MLDELRERMAAFLAAHQVGVLSTAGTTGAWAMPVRYRPAPDDSLAVECLLPGWADATYFLEQDPRVMLVIQDCPPAPLTPQSWGEEGMRSNGLRWLQILGIAGPVANPDWKGLLPAPPLEGQYRLVRVTPARLDLLDESQGWGARETLDV